MQAHSKVLALVAWLVTAPVAAHASTVTATVAQPGPGEARLGSAPALAGPEPGDAKLAEPRAVEPRAVEPDRASAPKKKPFAQGFTVSTDDARFLLRVRGLLQFDGRFFAADDARRSVDQFVLRTARPYLDGKAFGFVSFRLTPDFGGGTVSIPDAFVDLEAHPAVHLRFGKDTTNFGLERLQSQAVLALPERAAPSSLIPNRDLGVQLWGVALNGGLHYSVGMWNGVPDGASGDGDVDDRKDYAGRVFVKPFRIAGGPDSLGEVGLGFAAIHGIRRGTAAQPLLPTYRTPGQQLLAVYASSAMTPANGAIANGPLDRWSPQAAVYLGPLGLMAEYVHVSQAVKLGSAQASLIQDAWQLTANFFLTGERARYLGPDVLAPAALEPFSPGALELVLRYDAARFSHEGFGRFIDATKSFETSDSLWLGINWYLNDLVRFNATYVHTALGGGPATLRDAEDVVILRSQLWF